MLNGRAKYNGGEMNVYQYHESIIRHLSEWRALCTKFCIALCKLAAFVYN